jgi:fucose 4-O-acetylase-like acetyltransferase
MTAARSRIAFLDYFKCVGMTVIVYGHVAGWAPLAAFPPIYLKQIGVALFLFASGYSLARETRPARTVLVNRLFDVYLFGLALALILSVNGFFLDGHVRRSNYLPFAAGVNVLLDYFPANPTTWYVGTYVHFLVLWALLFRRVRLNLRMLVAAAAIEVLTRAVLLAYVGNFVAYMTFPNWMLVFLAGLYVGQRRIERVPGPSWTAWAWMGGAVLSVPVWLAAMARLPLRPAFPFMLPVAPGFAAIVLGSAAISVVYLVSTGFAFAIFTNLEAPAFVTFIAQNTLIIFLVHMPVYYAIGPLLAKLDLSRGLHSALLMIICLPGLGAVSHVVRHSAPVAAARRRARAWTDRGTAGPAAVEATAV